MVGPGLVPVQGWTPHLGLVRDALFVRDPAAAANEVAPVAAAAGRHGQTVAVEAATDDPVAVACHPGRPLRPTATVPASTHGCNMMTTWQTV